MQPEYAKFNVHHILLEEREGQGNSPESQFASDKI